MQLLSEIIESAKGRNILSFEFFPPKKSQGLKSTKNLIKELCKFSPDFMSVTYGAGGGTREFTHELVKYIYKDLNQNAVTHLTCVGASVLEIKDILSSLRSDGLYNILALRGDLPQEVDLLDVGELTCARDLVKLIKTEGDFDIAVAGYPEVHQDAVNQEEDLKYLLTKQEAGASLIITQLFFDSSYYFDFVSKAKSFGINIPILPGILPVSNVSQIKRFTEMCGASIPKDLLDELHRVEDDPQAVTEIGSAHALRQIQELLDGGAPGIHFYTLNKQHQIEDILAEVKHYFTY